MMLGAPRWTAPAKTPEAEKPYVLVTQKQEVAV